MKIPEEKLYHLSSDCLKVGVSNVGASVQSIRFKTPNGERELCLGFASAKERIASGTYCGAVIGRVANRIADAKYGLDGRIYHLSRNSGENTLHGGAEGFDSRLFTVAEEGDALKMTLISSDGDQGFGGELSLTVSFRVEKNALQVQFSAVSDRDTVWAPTLHPYFNFASQGDILDTTLQIYADEYTPMDGKQIPTGEIAPVEGTVFDFREPKFIGRDFNLTCAPLRDTGGYDHNFVLRGEHAATVFHKKSGIQMDIYTNLPGLHFYSGNYLKGHNGVKEYRPFEGLALEPQFFPNAVNEPNFETPLLKAGTTKSYFIRYLFDNI